MDDTGRIARYYELGREQARLLEPGAGELERLRTQEIVSRYLRSAPVVVLDVGGAAGIHALWLASLGHEVHLVDAVPLHVEQARAGSAQAGRPLASIEVGDARRLDQADASVDVVLLLGPLYHLVERADRVRALSEARRVVKPGGVVIAAAISRFAPAIAALAMNRLGLADFVAIAHEAATTGVHAPPESKPEWFTTSWFHEPSELEAELGDAGLDHVATLAVEGVAWLSPTLETDLANPEHRRTLLDLLRALETEPSLRGASSHLLAIGRRAS